MAGERERSQRGVRHGAQADELRAIQEEIARARDEVARSVVALRDRVVDSVDWRGFVRSRPRVAFVVCAGVDALTRQRLAGTGCLRWRRSGAAPAEGRVMDRETWEETRSERQARAGVVEAEAEAEAMEAMEAMAAAETIEERVQAGVDVARSRLLMLNERAVTAMRAHPGTTILVALGLGYLVGRMASRR